MNLRILCDLEVVVEWDVGILLSGFVGSGQRICVHMESEFGPNSSQLTVIQPEIVLAEWDFSVRRYQ